MLYIDPDEVKIVPSGRTKCVDCEERYASWGMKLDGGEDQVPFCGWCLMYGSSEWGRLNRDELVAVGEYVKASALARRGKNTEAPELDERHRLPPDAADRYVMGIIFTSRLLAQGPLGRLAKVGVAARDLEESE